MNRIYALVWSQHQAKFVVAHEKNTSRGKSPGGRKAVVGAVAGALLALGIMDAKAVCYSSDTTLTTNTTGSLCFEQSLTINPGVIAQNNNIVILMTAATATGSLVNGGTISNTNVTTNEAVAITNGSTLGGNIVNTGTMTAPIAGIGIYNASTRVDGSVINDGLIKGVRTDNGWVWAGIAISGATVHGPIINGASNSAALIYGKGASAGIAITSNAHVGGITNAGTILGDGWGGGISILDQSTVSGNIVNRGLIAGTTTSGTNGMVVSRSSVAGAIQNQLGGTISGVGTGVNIIGIASKPALVGGLTNSGTISGGNYSVFVGATNATLSNIVIAGNNSARFIGAVNAPNTDMSIASNATYAFHGDEAFTAHSFTNNGTAQFSNVGASNFDLTNITGGTFANNGTLAVSSATVGTLTGNYIQSAGAAFRLGQTNATTYGKLNVTGNATLDSGSTVDVRLSGTPGARLDGVIVAGGTLTDSGVTVTDNSVLYKFTASNARNAKELDLITEVDRTGIVNAIPAAVNPAGQGAALALQNMLNSGIPAGMLPVFDRMTLMTPAEISDAASQTLPVLVGAGSSAGMNALRSMNKIIQSRIESNQGLSSGDEGSDKYLWMRGFGNWGRQDDRNGVTGFKSDTGGLVFGVDTPVSERVRAGGAFTYARSNIRGNSATAPSRLDVDTYELVGYASYNLTPTTDINYQIDIGQNRGKSRRDIAFMGTTATAKVNSLAVHGSVGVGHTMTISEVMSVTPSVRLDYTHMRTKGYTESGAGPLNLNVDASTYRESLITGDVKFTRKLDDGLKLVGNVSAGYDFINKRAQTTATYTGGGPSFVTEGMEVSPWLYRGGLGLIKDGKNGIEYAVRYDAEGRSSGYLNQTLSARLRWAF